MGECRVENEEGYDDDGGDDGDGDEEEIWLECRL